MNSRKRMTGFRAACLAGLIPMAGLLPAGGAVALDDLRQSALEAEEVVLAAKIDRARRSDDASIVKAAIEDGVLVVVGVTADPKQKVTLDGTFRDRSGSDRVFTFEEIYLPDDCLVVVRTGNARLEALVQYCGLKQARKRAARVAAPAPVVPQGAIGGVLPGLPVQAVRTTNDESRRAADEIEPYNDEPFDIGCTLAITTTGGPVRLDAHFAARIEDSLASVTIVRSLGGAAFEMLESDGRQFPELWQGRDPLAYGQVRFIDDDAPAEVPLIYKLVLSRLEDLSGTGAVEFDNSETPCVLEAMELRAAG